MNLRAQNFYMSLRPQKTFKHKTPTKKENLTQAQNFAEFKEKLWTQHQIFNEPKAPKT